MIQHYVIKFVSDLRQICQLFSPGTCGFLHQNNQNIFERGINNQTMPTSNFTTICILGNKISYLELYSHVTFQGNSEISSHKTGGRLIQV